MCLHGGYSPRRGQISPGHGNCLRVRWNVFANTVRYISIGLYNTLGIAVTLITSLQVS